MLEYHQLGEVERRKVIRAAKAWKEKHSIHVERIMSGGHIAYPPSGSDIFKPELWKPAMWRWLAKQL